MDNKQNNNLSESELVNSSQPKQIESYKKFLPEHDKKLEILHFNDVYNIEEKEQKGPIIAGAARFISAFNQYNSKGKLVIFSGDLFFPSNMSIYYDGK